MRTLGSASSERATFAAGLALLLPCAGAAAAPSRRGPVQLSEQPLAVEPHLALSRDGEAVVSWVRELGAVCATAPDNPSCIHVLETRSRPASAWESAVEIVRPGVGPWPCVAVNDGGDAIVFWRHARTAQVRVVAVLNVAPPSSQASHPRAAP